MTCSITNVTGYATISMLTSMALSAILNELEVVLLADLANLLGVGNTTIKMHDCDSLGARSDCSLNEVVINLQGVWLWLNAYRDESVLSD